MLKHYSLTALLSAAVLSPQALAVEDSNFAPASIIEWPVREFEAPSSYQVTDGVLNATCKSGQASALYLERELELTEKPYLNWRWRVMQPPLALDEERVKAGDDFSARIYAVAERGLFGLSSKAVNFVWTYDQPIGASWPNPFTEQAMMVAMRNQSSPIGEWVTETVHLPEHFQRHFGVQVETIDGLALMVDCDNAGGERRFQLQRIWFSD
ncbi:DUF3047 domain-containing protein [Pseudidiomarina terrestris]|uniref:DUF3047 domain-containing protein n=1 Tax=Pseudidiomarina terrestris TaxID=2820060 RepID=A0AAW7R174_9GAMM|nr:MULTISPECIES: DUF3047 domain-containing protein [unclassified Pseudidiomarina]MDN7125451.1 DUF3047 domain-containing protein [Pseudidiomarina sp. 1APP75-32.1]MDN7128118.1 DUF3047 domain-containing protein [Pseudidiomarina sp. 1APR75-33.1]MDN7130209.1 DUF3047 domain-containing protein [Pseudidiomarina sp. 1APR75-15]MDN7135718.1 DUF3047 domain-containing protein [Pseudidiomarina sp. 1ASP75-5]MEA3588541.1 DUF3047 domain-containing protein [Pseudidiomarina sp. 1APP75-27a]